MIENNNLSKNLLGLSNLNDLTEFLHIGIMKYNEKNIKSMLPYKFIF